MDSTVMGEDATMLVLPPSGAGNEPAHLLLLEEGSSRRQLTVSAQPLTLGRAAPSDVLLEDALVSRQHCRFHVEGGRLTVTDLGSTNGTTLDGARLSGTAVLADGAVLRMGRAQLTYERHAPWEAECGGPGHGVAGHGVASQGVAGRAQAAHGPRQQSASSYVQMLLPRPLSEGPVRASWLTLPSAELGSNAFGYRFLRDGLFAGYMVDVAGQGTGAAMHAVAVMNLLRQHSVPGMDLSDPSTVLAGLNAMFPQEEHDGMFLLVWYFVLDLRARTLDFSGGGRRPALLVPPGREEAVPLSTQGPPVGLSRGHAFATRRVPMPAGSMLYLLSDGASESLARSPAFSTAGAVERLVCAPPLPMTPESLRIYDALRGALPSDAPEEDLSVLVLAA